MEDELKVVLVVYDLLPPSRLANFLNLVGSGVYHTSISLRIPLGGETDPSPREWAFGGHDSPGHSGVFCIPHGQAAARMPGLRPYMELDLGQAFGDDWDKAFMPKRRHPYPRPSSHAASTNQFFSTDSLDPFRDPPPTTSAASLTQFEWEPEDDGGESDGTQYMSRTQRRAWRTIETMRKDEAWDGTRYQLLGRNCNNFTDELAYRLTGRRAPGWINRAAWVATSVPCLVPPGWVDEEDLNATSVSSQANSSRPVVIVPPRAHQMTSGPSSLMRRDS